MVSSKEIATFIFFHLTNPKHCQGQGFSVGFDRKMTKKIISSIKLSEIENLKKCTGLWLCLFLYVVCLLGMLNNCSHFKKFQTFIVLRK
jgi:hypothetical protein